MAGGIVTMSQRGSQTIAQLSQSDPVLELDRIRPTAAKAGLRSDVIGLNRVMTDAVIGHYGSVKAAAFSLGEGLGQAPLDPSLMMREFKDGKFGRLDKADADTKAAIAEAFTDAYGRLSSPHARVRESIRSIRRQCDEVEQFIEFIK